MRARLAARVFGRVVSTLSNLGTRSFAANGCVFRTECSHEDGVRKRIEIVLIRRIARKFQVRQSHAIDHYLVSADCEWSGKILGSGVGHVIVLIDAVTTHAKAADQGAVFVERETSWKKDHSILVCVRRLRPLSAGMCQVVE